MYCLMTILINNNTIFLKFAEKVHLKCSHHTPYTHKKIPRWRDGDVNKPYCGTYFSIHTCIKSLHCTTEIYTMLLISYISIKLEGEKNYYQNHSQIVILTLALWWNMKNKWQLYRISQSSGSQGLWIQAETEHKDLKCLSTINSLFY